MNQNQTHREEIAGGFLWSPKQNANGARNQFYDNMREVEPGDIVFSFLWHPAAACGRRHGTRGNGAEARFWNRRRKLSREGWLVGVEFTRLETPLRPKDQIELIRPLLPTKYSPLRENGDGLQSVYLAEIPEELASLLINLAGGLIPMCRQLNPNHRQKLLPKRKRSSRTSEAARTLER